MSLLRPRLNHLFQTFLLVLLLAGGFARGEDVVLHLRNGDRIGGVIISENTNQIVLSNVWVTNLVIPLAQVEGRETPLALPKAPAIVADTNALPKAPAIVRDTNGLTGKLLVANMNANPGGKLPVNTNTFWRRWKGEVALGVNMERGATTNQLFYGRAKLTYAQPYRSDPKQFFRIELSYDAEYGKTAGTLSDNSMTGTWKTDFDVNRKVYVYNLGSAFYDEIRRIDLHYEEGPGVGYHWFNRTNFTLNLEAGINYQVEYRSDGTDDKSAYWRLAENMTWKLNKQISLIEKFEYFPRFGYSTQYRMRFEGTLAYALMHNLSFNVSAIDFYDTQPAAGVPNNDFQLQTSLGMKF